MSSEWDVEGSGSFSVVIGSIMHHIEVKAFYWVGAVGAMRICE